MTPKEATMRRVEYALLKLELAQCEVRKACASLCSVSGASKIYMHLWALTDKVQASWFLLDDVDKKNWTLDHKPIRENELNEFPLEEELCD